MSTYICKCHTCLPTVRASVSSRFTRYHCFLCAPLAVGLGCTCVARRRVRLRGLCVLRNYLTTSCTYTVLVCPNMPLRTILIGASTALSIPKQPGLPFFICVILNCMFLWCCLCYCVGHCLVHARTPYSRIASCYFHFTDKSVWFMFLATVLCTTGYLAPTSMGQVKLGMEVEIGYTRLHTPMFLVPLLISKGFSLLAVHCSEISSTF